MISEDECSKIIEKSILHKNFKLINFEIKKASDDNIGFLGEYFKLTIEISENHNSDTKKLQYFIKAIPQSNLEQKKLVQDIGVFKKEERIYKLFEELKAFSTIKFHPKYFFSREDLIVLEDLSINGYYQMNGEIEYNLTQLKAILSALASMHAASIAYEYKTNVVIGDELKDELFETSVTKDIEWFLVGLEAINFIASQHPKFQTIEYKNFILSKEFLKKLDPICDMVNTSKKYRNVLCHRDVWVRNIFFKDDNDNNNTNQNNTSLSSVLVDYQTYRYCPPALDILFLLHINVRRKLRNTIYTECLVYYHQMLEQNLIRLGVPEKQRINMQEISQSCKDFKLFGIVYDCIAATIVKLPKGYLTDLKEKNPKEYYQYINVNRNDKISEFLKDNEIFREYLFDVIEELMELIY